MKGIASRVCNLCYDELARCSQCGSEVWHRHVQIRNRFGAVLYDVALCGECVGQIRLTGPPLMTVCQRADRKGAA